MCFRETDEYSNYCTCIKQDYYNLEITCEDKMMNKTIDTTFTENICHLFILLLLLPVAFIIVYVCCSRTELTFLRYKFAITVTSLEYYYFLTCKCIWWLSWFISKGISFNEISIVSIKENTYRV